MNLSPLRIVIAGVDNYSKEMQKIKKEVGGMASSMKSAGGAMSTYISLPLAAAAGAAIKLSTDFNKSMANVASLIPGTGDRIDTLKTGVQSLAIEMGKSTDDLAGGLYQVISAFGDTDDALGQLKITSMAAKAGLASTEEALALLSSVTKGYGDTSTAAMTRSADLALTTVKLGQTTFPELAASMGKVVPISKALGVSQEELFASFATLTGVTGNAAEVSTQMSAVMVAMLKPSMQLQKLTKKLGYSSASAMMQQKGLAGSLDVLSKATGGSADAMGMLLGSKEAVVGALALTGAQAGEMSNKMKAMAGSAGAMVTAFGAQTKGINAVGFRMEQAQQRITVAFQKIGDMLLPIVAKVIDAAMPIVDLFTNMGPAAMGAVLGFGAVVAAIGPLLVVVGSLISSWVTVSGAIVAAGGVMALLTGPVAIAIGVIAGLIFLFIALGDNIKPLKDMVGGALAGAFALLSALLKPVWAGIMDLWEAFVGIVKILQPVAIALGILVAIVAAPFLAPIIASMFALVWVFQKLASIIKYSVEGWALLFKVVGDFFKLIDDAMGGPVQAMMKSIGDLVTAFTGGPKKLELKTTTTTNGTPGAPGTLPPGTLPGSPAAAGAAAGAAAFPSTMKPAAPSEVLIKFSGLPAGTSVQTSGPAKVQGYNGATMAGAY